MLCNPHDVPVEIEFEAQQLGNRIATETFRLDPGEQIVGPSDNGSLLLETPRQGGWTVRFPDGSRQEFDSDGFPLRRIDSNGNVLGDFADTLGRPFTECGASNPCLLSYRDSSGQLQTFQSTSELITITPDFSQAPCSGDPVIVPASLQLSVVTALTMINGLQYTFEYDPAGGELARINLPAGGYIRYQWQTLEDFDEPPGNWACRLPSRRVVERALSADGSASSEDVYSYSYGFILNAAGKAIVNYTTTVTNPEGGQSVHLFEADGVHELRSEVKQADGSALLLTDCSWDNDFGPVASPNLPFDTGDLLEQSRRNWRIVETLTTLQPGNKVSKGTAEYDTFAPPWDFFSLDSRMAVKKAEAFDYGTGSPGPLLRRTETEYLHDANPSYDALHIWDRATLQSVYEPDGSLSSQMRTRYDDTALTASTAVQHQDPGSLRGNPTTGRGVAEYGKPLDHEPELLRPAGQPGQGGRPQGQRDPVRVRRRLGNGQKRGLSPPTQI